MRECQNTNAAHGQTHGGTLPQTRHISTFENISTCDTRTYTNARKHYYAYKQHQWGLIPRHGRHQNILAPKVCKKIQEIFPPALQMLLTHVVFLLAALSGSLNIGGSGATVCSENVKPGDTRAVPFPKSLSYVPFSTTCVQSQQGFAYDNSNFSDGNGPRGAVNASDCCAQV